MRIRWFWVTILCVWATSVFAEDGLHMRTVDVGAGLCVVVAVQSGDETRYAIYDTGRWGGSTYSAIKQVIPPGSEVDLLVLSHADSDHYGAVPEIMQNYKVRTVLRTGVDRDQLPDDENPETIKRGRNAIAKSVQEHQTLDVNLSETDIDFGEAFQVGEAELVLVCGWGEMPYSWGLTSASKIRNAVSITMRLDYEERSILLTGDAVGRKDGSSSDADCIATEEFMLEGEVPIKADVLVAAHHGADNGNCLEFIESVGPEYVIFSAGSDYGHPRESTAKRFLQARDSQGNALLSEDTLFRTDLGDNEGGKEWSYGSTPHGDRRGDDDIDVFVSSTGGLTIGYRNEFGLLDSTVQISYAIPDPPGNDLYHESVTLANVGTEDVSLDDWLLRDSSNRTWQLSGIVLAGHQLTFVRNGSAMSLNNDGDSIELIAPSGRAVDRLRYNKVVVGEVVKASDRSSSAGAAMLSIVSLLPNPSGSDSQNEVVTLHNMGSSSVDLQGWYLRDANGLVWKLIGTIDPGDDLAIVRDHRPMSLNNNGDTVELINAFGQTIDSLSYGPVTEGQLIRR